MKTTKTLLTLLATVACAAAGAAPSPGNGTAVRIQTNAIEGGWHTGKLQLDAQKCWMVKLDKPTRDNYTMLALIVASELQVASDGGWTTVGIKPLLQSQPEVCREYAND